MPAEDVRLVRSDDAPAVNRREMAEAAARGLVVDVEAARRNVDTPMAAGARKMLETGALADVAVTLQRKTWKLHRMQLAMGCRFFAERFCAENKGASTSSASADRIELEKDCVPGGKSAFDACVKHIYMHDSVEKAAKIDDLPALAAAASVLGVDEGGLEAQVLSELKERLKSAGWENTALVLAAASETRVRELAPACVKAAKDRVAALVIEGSSASGGSSASEEIDGLVDLESMLEQLGDAAHELLGNPKLETKPSRRSWWARIVLTNSSSDKLVAWATDGRLVTFCKMVCVEDAKASLWELIARILNHASDEAKKLAFFNKTSNKRKKDDSKWDDVLAIVVDLGAESIMLKREPPVDSIPMEAIIAMERNARVKLEERIKEERTKHLAERIKHSAELEKRINLTRTLEERIKEERIKHCAERAKHSAALEERINLTRTCLNAIIHKPRASKGLPLYWNEHCKAGLCWEASVKLTEEGVGVYFKPCITGEDAAVKARVRLSSPMACHGTSERCFEHEWKTGDHSRGYRDFFPKDVLSDPRCATDFFNATIDVLCDGS